MRRIRAPRVASPVGRLARFLAFLVGAIYSSDTNLIPTFSSSSPDTTFSNFIGESLCCIAESCAMFNVSIPQKLTVTVKLQVQAAGVY